MGVCENAAYLKGLCEGLGVNEETKEGKMIVKMLDVIEELAKRVDYLEKENDELYGYFEEMAQDLVCLEDDFYADDEEYEDYSDLNEEEDDEDFDGEDVDYYEMTCPNCSEVICFTDDISPEDLICPACGVKISEFEASDGE